MRSGYRVAFAACAAAALLPLFVTSVLPMTDLPEHMAQIAIWKHYGDPCHQFARTFEFNWATPYLLGYLLTRLLAIALPVSAAIKITVALGIVATPLSIRALLRRAGGDDAWLSLLGFPLAFGYAFYWGFLNFWIAIPLGILYIALLYDERSRWWVRALLAFVLMIGHGLIFVFCAGVTVAVAIIRRAPALVLPTIPAAILFAFSVLRLQIPEQAVREGINWKPSAMRFTELPSHLVANAWEPLGLVLIAAIALILIVMRPGITRDVARWAFVVSAAAAYLIGPFAVSGSVFFYGRFAVFVAVAALFLFNAPRRARHAGRALLIVLVLASMALLTVRFSRFGDEARQLDPLIDRMPANRRVVLFNVLPFSEHVPGPVFWHFAGLYQVRKGGLIGWSFSNHFVTLVRYRDGAEPPIGSRSTPVDGIDWPGVLQYDYILVRGADVRRWMFRQAPVAIPLIARSGDWWLFETPRARTPQRDCPPLAE